MQGLSRGAGAARIAGLLLLGLLLLVGQSVWAAGYRPPRSLGSWHLLQQGQPPGSPTEQPRSPAEYYAADASPGGKAGAAPQPAAAASSPEEQQQQQEQQQKQQQELEQQERQAAAEAEARAVQDAAAVQGPGEEAGPDLDDSDDAGVTPEQEEKAKQQDQQQQQQQQPSPSPQPPLPSPQPPSPSPQPPSPAPAAAPPQDMPYDLKALPDVESLFKAHTKWQQQVIQEKRKGVPAVKVETGEGHGLGNRMPAIGTGYVLAVLTGRLFFLQSTVSQHLDLPFPHVWKEYESLYADVDRCDLGHFTKFVNPDLKFCGPPGTEQDKTATLLIQNFQFDYMLPMFQINPTLKPHFDKFFPDSEVYSKVARYLYRPKPVLQEALKPYEALSSNCLVGMHLRTKKYGTAAPVEQFAAIARAVAVARPGNVFVAADADVFKQAQEHLPGREVWWNKRAAEELQAGNKTAAGNPGTELSAMMDLWLLSRCKNVILTPASSIGSLAAALGGVFPVFANPGPHTDPFTNPWFWKAVSSEPCFVKAAEVHKQDTELAKRFRKEHPLFVYHNQCHFAASAIGVPAPTWECTAKDCREFRR